MEENPLAVQDVKKLIGKYAFPGILSQLINSLHNIVDQIFIGWGIGDLGIAATNVTFPFSTVMTAVSALIGMGAAARFNILLGKKRPRDAADIFGTAIAMMLSMSLLIAALASAFLPWVLDLFGATALIMPYAYPYARIICLGIPLGIFSSGMSYFIRADGSPGYSSAVLLSGAGVNMALDPVFLFGCGMGIRGIALATVLGQLTSTVLALYYLLKRFRSVRLSAADIRLRGGNIRTIFSLGLATFTTHVLATFSQIVQANALRHYGALSAYGSEVCIEAAGAVNKLTIVFLSGIIGIAIGCQPIWGFNLGSRRYERVRETYRLALRYGTAVAAAAYLALQLFPGQILRIFGSQDPLFYAFATRYIRIYLAVLFLNAIQPTTSMFCTAIGKAKLGFWMAVIRQGLLMIPLLTILPRFLGVDGVLFAGGCSDLAAALIVLWIGRREMRRLTEAARTDPLN